jgi:hypothetical protein
MSKVLLYLIVYLHHDGMLILLIEEAVLYENSLTQLNSKRSEVGAVTNAKPAV